MEPLKSYSDNRGSRIDFNPETGQLTIEGFYMIENPHSYFLSIIKWLDLYVKRPCPTTHVRVYLKFCNASSSAGLLELFYTLRKGLGGFSQIKVDWLYGRGDQCVRELGQDLASILHLKFNMIEVEN